MKNRLLFIPVMVTFFISFMFFSSFYNVKTKLTNFGSSNDIHKNYLGEMPVISFDAPKVKNTPPQNNLGQYIPITGNTDQLKYFFNALKESGNKKIRVGYYGDSIILGDVISEYVRQSFQDKFGGNGIGYVSIVSQDIKMRQSVYHQFSDDWESVSIIGRNPKNLPFGIDGIYLHTLL